MNILTKLYLWWLKLLGYREIDIKEYKSAIIAGNRVPSSMREISKYFNQGEK